MTPTETAKQAFGAAVAVISGNASKAAKASAAMIATDAIVKCSKMAENAICKRGCSHCCHHAVAIMPQEAALISSHTGRKVSKPRTQGYDRESRAPCPFLKENECSIYEVRPMACRTFFTYDSVEYCIKGDVEHKIGTIQSNNGLVALAMIMMKDCGNKDADIREFFR